MGKQGGRNVNIIVFMKQVADTEAHILVSGDKLSLEIENKYAVNFFDELAIEEALRIKERQGAQVTVRTYASNKAIEALRTAIAMGADRAFLIDNAAHPEGDALFIAGVLSAFARKEGFDLIFTGRQAIDDENAAIGPMVAELLSIPHTSAVTRLDVTDKKVTVEHDVEGGRETAEMALPALITAQKGLNEPRVPLIMGVMKAMKAAIPVVDPASLGIGEGACVTRILSYEHPPKRPAVKIMEGESAEEKVKNLLRLLKDEARAL
jgi:electron transfer flavoprotein beta subunit